MTLKKYNFDMLKSKYFWKFVYFFNKKPACQRGMFSDLLFCVTQSQEPRFEGEGERD